MHFLTVIEFIFLLRNAELLRYFLCSLLRIPLSFPMLILSSYPGILFRFPFFFILPRVISFTCKVKRRYISICIHIYIYTRTFAYTCAHVHASACMCVCVCIFHLTTLPECSFNDTSEKFNKRTKELFWDAGSWRNWKTNLGRIPLFASFSLIWLPPFSLRLQEISNSRYTSLSRRIDRSALKCAYQCETKINSNSSGCCVLQY